jgi:hypothetical protein
VEVRVTRLRDAGRSLAQWNLGTYDVQGPLRLEEQRSEELHRHVRVAHVAGCRGDGTPSSLTLYDAALVFVGPDIWTMTGFERLEAGDGKSICHLQSWALRPVTAAMLRDDECAREQAQLSRQFSEHIASFTGPPAAATIA